MVDAADVGGIVFAGAYLLTAPVVLIDGPQPGPVDVAWMYGLARAYNIGRRLGGYADEAIDIFQATKEQAKPKKSIEELKWTPKQNQNLWKKNKLERSALHNGLWIVRRYEKKKKATSKGLYA